MADDSPLSIAANITGILTFAVAILIGIYARMISLRQEVTGISKILDDISGTAFTIFMQLGEVTMLEEMSDRTDKQSFDLLSQLYYLLLETASALDTVASKSLLQVRLGWDETSEQIKTGLRDFERPKQLLVHKQSISLRR